MLRLRFQYQTHLVTLVVSKKVLLGLMITMARLPEHSKTLFLFVVEQQICLTQHMLRSAKCYAAVLLLKMLSKLTHTLRGRCHKRSCCFSLYGQHDILHAKFSLYASCSVAEGLCIMKLYIHELTHVQVCTVHESAYGADTSQETCKTIVQDLRWSALQELRSQALHKAMTQAHHLEMSDGVLASATCKTSATFLYIKSRSWCTTLGSYSLMP